MRLHVSLGLASVVAELATKGSLGSVPIAYVRRQRGGGWTGHITHRALMMGDMAAHVVFQKPLNRKALATSLAWEVQLGNIDGKDIISNLRKCSARCNLVRVLPFHMVQELAPGGKESSAGWTAHQLFLTVAPHMLFEFGDCGDNDFTTCPLTKQGFLPFQRICMIVEVQEEVLRRGPVSLAETARPVADPSMAEIGQQVPLASWKAAWRQSLPRHDSLAVSF